MRVEELYPWPDDAVAESSTCIHVLEEVVWAQEEPKNMGAWSYVSPRLRVSTGNAMIVRYIGRPGAREPGRGLRIGARGGAGADRREVLNPSAGRAAATKRRGACMTMIRPRFLNPRLLAASLLRSAAPLTVVRERGARRAREAAGTTCAC